MTANHPKPKILMFLMFPLWGSGSGVYARKLAETLAKRGYEVAIACPDNRAVPGVKVITVDIPYMAAFTSHPEHPESLKYSELSSHQLNELYVAFHKGLTEAVEKFQPNVVHVHHAAHLAWVAAFCRAAYRINYLITVHGTDVFNASLDRRYIAPTIDALNRADFVTVVSPQTRKWMFKVFGSKNYFARVRTITGGVDTVAYPLRGPVERVDKKYGLMGKNVVLFTGKLIPTKGVKYLVSAARDIDADVVILGDGPERPRLIQQANGNPRIHFPGYVSGDELPEWYRRADVLAVPSVWDEPLGLISLEAMSSGTPVVASNKGGIGAAVKHGQNGYLVRARSAVAISRAVNKILGDSQLHTRMAKNARENIEKRFSWEVIADHFEPYYTSTSLNTTKRQQLKQPLHVAPEDIEREKRDIDVIKKDHLSST